MGEPEVPSMAASHRVSFGSSFVFIALVLPCLACARGGSGEGFLPLVDAAAAKKVAVGCAASGGSPCTSGAAPIDAPTTGAVLAPVDDSPGSADDDAGDVPFVVLADDGGDGDDGGEPAAFASPAGPGDLAITEIMLAPSGPEPGAEWFEIYNRAGDAKFLSGLTIEDGYQDAHVIASSPAVAVGAHAYVVLVRDLTTAEDTAVPSASIVYAYGGGLPSNEGIELDAFDLGDLSLWNADTLLVDVPYGMWNAASVGQSIELDAPESSETDPNHWCFAETPWALGSDDGTPGAPSDCLP
jgi:Lamin Tail Domain